MSKRSRPGKAERKHSEAKAIPYDAAGAVGGDPSRRAFSHHIPEKDRHPSVSGASLDPMSRDYVPVNETPPPHVLDPEGHAKRVEKDQQEARAAAYKRNESIAKDEGTSYAPRPARTSRDRAIQSGGKIPYDNSQPGAFRDSSQKDGHMPEERYKDKKGSLKGDAAHPPVTPDGRTSQQADTPPGGTLPSGNASAPSAVEGGDKEKPKKKK